MHTGRQSALLRLICSWHYEPCCCHKHTHIQNNALTLLATSEHGKTQLTDHDYPSMRCKCNCIHTCVCCRCALVKMPLINTCRSAKPAQARSEVTAFLTKSMGYLGDLQATGKPVRVQCCQRMCVSVRVQVKLTTAACWVAAPNMPKRRLLKCKQNKFIGPKRRLANICCGFFFAYNTLQHNMLQVCCERASN